MADEPEDTEAGRGKQSLRLWLRLYQVTTHVEKEVQSYLRTQCGTTLPRFDVLAALDRSRIPMTMSQLSERLLVSNGNVTGLVARLVEDGLVGRVTDPSDRRNQLVFLTPEGQSTFRRIAQKHEAFIDEMMSSLDAQTMDDLQELTGRLVRSLKIPS